MVFFDMTPRNGDLAPAEDTPFLVGDYDDGRPPKTLHELRLMRFMNEIRKKSDWTTKINNEEICSKWLAEARSQRLTEREAQYGLDECRWWASKATKEATISAVEGVFVADGVVAAELTNSLRQGLAVLENVPDEQKDWHPGSDETVLDVIHPSLFPVVYGVSRVVWGDEMLSFRELMSSKSAVVIPKPHDKEVTDYYVSDKFQWLPAEVAVDVDGKCTFTSYINNLHPEKHTGLYESLARLLDHFIPLFNATLTEGCREPILREEPDMSRDSLYPDRPSRDAEDWEHDEWWETRAPTVPPFSEVFKPFAEPAPVDLKGRQLQVIVKVASIHLTPEKPRYNGGSWHVEGMKNESIVATGLYYYDIDNITKSELAFRIAVAEPGYEQCDDPGVLAVYGMVNEGQLSQSLGAIEAVDGRLVAFPNYCQHQVQPFRLADPTKPGQRKIIAFFLVDPAVHIPSSKNIVPQNVSWHDTDVGLPTAVKSHVLDFLDCPFSLERAKEYRKELMAERSAFTAENEEEYFLREFSLCEH